MAKLFLIGSFWACVIGLCGRIAVAKMKQINLICLCMIVWAQAVHQIVGKPFGAFVEMDLFGMKGTVILEIAINIQQATYVR